MHSIQKFLIFLLLGGGIVAIVMMALFFQKTYPPMYKKPEKFQSGYFQHPNEIDHFQSNKKTVSWK